MQIDDIITKAPAPFEASDSEKTLALVDLVEMLLGDRPLDAAPIGTSELCRALRPSATKEQTKKLVAWLQHCRNSGLMENYFSRGKPAPGTFGKPRILWKATPRKEMTMEERRAWIATQGL